MKYELKHALPGRVRFLLPALKHSRFTPAALAERLRAEPGVQTVRFSRHAGSVTVEYAGTDAEVQHRIRNSLLNANPREFWQKQPVGSPASPATYANRGFLAVAATALAAAIAGVSSGVQIPLLLVSGIPSYQRAYRTLVRERRLNVDFLDTIVLAFSALRGEPLSGALVAFLVNLGEWIRDFTSARSRRAIDNILRFQSQRAWVLRHGRKRQIPADRVKPGDTVIVYVGELIPVDGVVIRSHGLVDQKTITGESVPVDKRAGDKVFAGTALLNGKLYIRAKRVAGATVAAGIVQMVASTPVGETRMQNYAEKFADKLVAPSLLLGGGLYALTGDPQRFLSTLIVDYGTGMRVAAPTSMLACLIQAARQGVVVKSGAYLERLAHVDTIIFDKTGTLTGGSPQIMDVRSYRPAVFSPETILSLAAAAEARYQHPVAHAVVSKAREQGVEWLERTQSRYQVGSGVEANVNGYFVQIGSERFMSDRRVPIGRALDDTREFERDGYSALLMAVNGELAGVLSYADQIRPEVPSVIAALRQLRRFEMVMITGDREFIARRVASRLTLDRYFAETMPGHKAGIVERLQKAGHVVAMVGDGINDSPGLSRADVGISMRNGSDLTRETADIILMEENMWKLVTAFENASRAVHLIRQNWKLIAVLNTIALLLALPGGLVSPNVTAFLSNGSSILGALNGLRPLISQTPERK